MYKSIACLFLVCFSAALASNGVALQLVNALIGSTNTGSTGLTASSSYGGLGFSAPAACPNTTFPTLDFLTLNICYGSSISYPFRNATSGYEYDLINGWNATLASTYNASVTVQAVPITVGSAGLFTSLTTALQAGQCQVLLSTIYQNPTRDASFNASCPYTTVFGGALYINSTFGTQTNISVFNQTNVVAAVASGSGTLNTLKALLNFAGTVLLTSGTADSISRVANGSASVAFAEGPVLAAYAASNKTGCNGTVCGFINGNAFALGPYNVVAYSSVPASASSATTGASGATTGASGATTGASGATTGASGGTTSATGGATTSNTTSTSGTTTGTTTTGRSSAATLAIGAVALFAALLV